MKWTSFGTVFPMLFLLAGLHSSCSTGTKSLDTPTLPEGVITAAPHVATPPVPSTASSPAPTATEIPVPSGVTFDLDPSLNDREVAYLKGSLVEILAQAELDFGVKTPEFTLVAYREQSAIVEKKASFEGVSSATMGDRFWCDFCGETDYGAIHIRLGTGWFDESGFPDSLIGYTVLAHELHHLFQAQSVGSTWRTTIYSAEWLSEGAAHWWGYHATSIHLGESFEPYLRSFIPYAKADPITLKEMENRAGFNASQSGSYNYSLLAVDLLMKDRPPAVLLEVWVKHLSRGVNWQDAFKTVFGTSAAEFYSRFGRYLADSVTESSVSGSVTTLSGAPLPEGFVLCASLFSEPQSCWRAVFDGNSFNIVLPPGIYVLSIQTGSGNTRFHGPDGITRDRPSAVRLDLTTTKGATRISVVIP